MPRDLSIENAVEIRQCGFQGCATCPFRVIARPTHGCVREQGAVHLYVAAALARVLGDQRKADRIKQLASSGTETVERDDGQVWDVLGVEHVRELAEALGALHAAGERLCEEGFEQRVRPEWTERVRAELWSWIPHARADGTGPLSLERPLLYVSLLRRFLQDAAERGQRVEVGRYDVGFVPSE